MTLRNGDEGQTRRPIERSAVKARTQAAIVRQPGEPNPSAQVRRLVAVRAPQKDKGEFLASALVVVEHPNSPAWPKARATIILMFACIAAWSYFGYLEDYTVAMGKLQVVGRTKIIEPREPGQVLAVSVKDGDRVKDGQVLVELDPTTALANSTIVAEKVFDVRAQMAALNAELIASRKDPVDVNPAIVWDDDIPAPARARAESSVRADLAQLAATITNLTEQRKAAEVQRDKFAGVVEAQKGLIAVTNEHVDMDQSLAAEGWNSRLKVLEILGKVRQQQISLSKLQTDLADSNALIPVIDSEIAKAHESFATSAAQSWTVLDRQLDDLKQQLAKADQALSDMTLRAPLSGVVQGAKVTTVGQVVTPGQQLMELVPEGLPLEAIAYITNTNVGFIKVGQKIDVKVQTFPYATYGTVPGIVTDVAKDSLPAVAANTLQTAALDGEASQTSAAQKTGNLVFPITVKLQRNTMNIDGRAVSLISGMAVGIDIKTEDRRAIDYVWSPLVELLTTAAHEQQ
jgi:hemolysin D